MARPEIELQVGSSCAVPERVLLSLGVDSTNVGKAHQAWSRLPTADQRRIQVVPGLTALVLATLFAGAALYISLVSIPPG